MAGYLPDGDNLAQSIFLIAVYGFILFKAACLIGDGSEMLLLLYGPGIVGGLLIPILGAVPDGAIILLSGLGGGSKEELQTSLGVGIGTLAGSTIMLITVPWALGVFFGRRDRGADGKADSIIVKGKKKAKYTKFSWTDSVVTSTPDIPAQAKIMMLASLSLWIIQIPAFIMLAGGDSDSEQESYEHIPALIGLIVSALGFIAYSLYQLFDAKAAEAVKRAQREQERAHWKKSLKRKFGGPRNAIEKVFGDLDKDKNGTLDLKELSEGLRMLGLETNRAVASEIFQEMDTDKSGTIELDEFETCVKKYISHAQASIRTKGKPQSDTGGLLLNAPDDDEGGHSAALLDDPEAQRDYGSGDNEDGGDDDEDVEEEEEEYLEKTNGQILMNGTFLLVLGTAIVCIFSDPMVGAINNFSTFSGVPPFFVSFIITPLASNASEVVAALIFAQKKTNEGISLTFASLYGAATMNNTFCLAIFCVLIYARDLRWNFGSEIIAIVVVIFCVGVIGLKQTVNMRSALMVGLLFPVSLGLVAVLKYGAKLDNK